jgi:uncharacterized protein DUF3105
VGLGVVLLAGVLALVAFGGDDDSSSATISSRYCSEKTFPGRAPRHLLNPDANVTYNSFPPSSGPHFQQFAPWGIYEEPIKQTILVHNLEHGGVVIQYGDVGEETVREIQAFFQDDPKALVVAPYPKLGKKIALTAWNAPPYDQGQSQPEDADPGRGHVLTCTQWDADAAAEFRDKRRGRAGERFPIDQLVPGS